MFLGDIPQKFMRFPEKTRFSQAVHWHVPADIPHGGICEVEACLVGPGGSAVFPGVR